MRISRFRRAAIMCALAAVVVLGTTSAAADVRHRHYDPFGAIEGQIVEAGTGNGVHAYVTLSNRASGDTFSFDTTSDGSFQEVGLDPGDYDMCADGYPGADRYGYVGRCHGSPQWWLGGSATSRSVAVHVDAGTTTVTGIALRDAGAIMGRLRDARTGDPIPFAQVTLFQNGIPVRGWDTDAHGRYRLIRLPQARGSSGFQVCFWIRQDYVDTLPPTGWAPQCWRNRQWTRTGSLPPAAGSARVPVTAGVASSGITASMQRGAGISGVIRAAGGSHPVLRFTEITVFRNGLNVGEGGTTANGHYRLHSLPPGRYVVCASGGAPASAPRAEYGARCWRNVGWDGSTAPAGAPTVSTSTGTVHTGINLFLPSH